MPEVGTVWTFDYTGAEQLFKVSRPGIYKLETWGAQGGSIENFRGGYGGYSSGNIKLSKNSVIYVVIGGMGIGATGSGQDLIGGYNGGGEVKKNININHINGSGGGATHMAIISGLLSELNEKKDNILIVAGGGGGARNQSNHSTAARWGNGGDGGGYLGVGPTSSFGSIDNSFTVVASLAGTQNSGYAFGHGEWCTGNSGGGSGYYGGYGGCRIPYTGSGGGGSGYIGNTSLYNKTMYCYNCETSSEESAKTISTTCTSESPTENCSKQGNGYARITLISY